LLKVEVEEGKRKIEESDEDEDQNSVATQKTVLQVKVEEEK
jgi:hypothetical protein